MSDDFFADRLCCYAEGTDPNRRDPDACPKVATNITEEGYPYCAEHAEVFYRTVAILSSPSDAIAP